MNSQHENTNSIGEFVLIKTVLNIRFKDIYLVYKNIYCLVKIIYSFLCLEKKILWLVYNTKCDKNARNPFIVRVNGSLRRWGKNREIILLYKSRLIFAKDIFIHLLLDNVNFLKYGR